MNHLPAEVHAESHEIGIATEVPVGIEVVGEVVVVVVVELLLLRDAPGVIEAFIQRACIERRDAYARE